MTRDLFIFIFFTIVLWIGVAGMKEFDELPQVRKICFILFAILMIGLPVSGLLWPKQMRPLLRCLADWRDC